MRSEQLGRDIPIAEAWSREADRSKLCWQHATAATLSESWRVHPTSSTVSHVNTGQQTVAYPVLEGSFEDHFETLMHIAGTSMPRRCRNCYYINYGNEAIHIRN
ncbi:hypothetical protein Y032_0112g300 [Ancylostoma ceylanicum]|nr:hypothetical protein Y032_0112g300 [Ancylostoma ceylanicum]